LSWSSCSTIRSSRHSRRNVSTTRSATAFALGALIGVRTLRMPAGPSVPRGPPRRSHPGHRSGGAAADSPASHQGLNHKQIRCPDSGYLVEQEGPPGLAWWSGGPRRFRKMEASVWISRMKALATGEAWRLAPLAYRSGFLPSHTLSLVVRVRVVAASR
jgi:hypothetical protein